MIFWTAVVLGFMGSFHCVGMCGPIAMAVGNSSQKFLTNKILYNIGRSITYALLGLIVGVIGFTFSLAGIQQAFSIFIGLMIILIAVSVKGSERWVSISFLATPVRWIKSRLAFFLKRGGATAFFATGLVNGLLPCGMVYLALVAALGLQNPWMGAAYMFFFGLGTIPLLLALMFSGKLIPLKSRLKIQKVMPLVGVLVGLIFIFRGLGLGIHGFSPNLQVYHYGEKQVEITVCR